MTRPVGSTITTAERQPGVKPTHAATLRRELLSFAAFAAVGNGSLDAFTPQTYVMRPTGTLAYVTFRYANGNSYLRVMDTANASDYGLSSASASAITYKTMRHGLVNEGGTVRAYSADITGSGVQVKRATLTGTTNPVSLSWSNFGAVFGEVVSDTSSLVRRVEAVCPTDGGGVIVAVGSHDFTTAMSTIRFWHLLDASNIVALNTIIQIPLEESYSNWYTHAKTCAFISAIYDASAGRVIVFANDQADVRAVMFTIQNNIESEVRPVVPLPPGQYPRIVNQPVVSLYPCAATILNGVFYLSAHFSRLLDGRRTSFDCYLRSADGLNWSFGERSFFVSRSTMFGSLLMRNDSPSVVVFTGNTVARTAPLTPLQSSSSTLSAVIDSNLEGWSLDMVASGADSFGADLNSAVVSGGGKSLDSEPNLTRDAVILLQSGQSGTLADVGRYSIDAISDEATTDGRAVTRIKGRDQGNKKIIDARFGVEMDFASRVVSVPDLSKSESIELKTPDLGDEVKWTASGLVYGSLNNPLIAYVEGGENGDTLLKATVRMDVDNGYGLSVFGFVWGANDDGEGNVILVPKVNSWNDGSGLKTTATVRTLNLKAIDATDPKKEDTGWNLKDSVNGLWQGVLSNSVRTAAASVSYRTFNANQFIAGTTADVAARISGRRVQLFMRSRGTSPTDWADRAGYVLQVEALTDYQLKRAQYGADRVGLAVSTDVWADVPSQTDVVYDDIEQTLTSAGNYADTADFTALKVTGAKPTGSSTVVGFLSSTAGLTVGQYVRLDSPGNFSSRHKITAVTSTSITVTPGYPSGLADGSTIRVYELGTADWWGYAASQKRTQDAAGVKTIIDPKAQKTAQVLRGRGFFRADNSSVGAVRFLESDGVAFYLRSGSAETEVGWDSTNPILPADDAFYNSGSDPSVWRVIFRPGFLRTGSMSAVGLPSSGYMRIGKERVRYEAFTFNKRGNTASETWTIIPAYYCPLAAQAGGFSTLRNWRSSAGAQPGDDLGTITGAAGMLAEVTSGTGSSQASNKRHYVLSATFVASPSVGSTSYVTLDKPYENEVAGSDPTSFAGNGDFLTLSGRGQDDTEKEKHPAGTPILYLPRAAGSSDVASVTVQSFEAYSGRYQAAEDVLRRMAAIAGVRSAAFRNRHTTPTTNVSTVLGTTPYVMPTPEDVSNFVLDMRAHIPGNSTNGAGLAGITGAKALRVSFRGYYRLWIQQYATAADINAGTSGKLRVGIETTSTDISAAAADGIRWLEWAIVPVGDYTIAGAATGSNPNYTMVEDVARVNDIRVVVQDNLVSVEVNGLPVWTFNLDRFTDGTNSWKRTTAGAVSVDYSSSPGSYTATLRVLELGEECERFIAQRGSTVASAMSNVAGRRRVRIRASTDGGLTLTRFEVRDDAGALSENLWREKWSRTDLTRKAHLLVAGKAAGEYLDEAVAAASGYSFDAVTNDAVTTGEGATIEARLLARESLEFDTVREVDGVGLIEIQPEDKITLAYDSAGDGPAHALTTHVVTSASIRATLEETTGTYVLRDFVA